MALAKSAPAGPLRRRRRKMRVIRGGKVERSDPTPGRLSQAETHFEVSDTLILRFQDDGLGRAFRGGLIDKGLYEVGRRYHEIWHLAGLAGHVPAMGMETSIVCGENDFGGMPRTQHERNHRLLYRSIVQGIGLIHSRIVELVACRGHKVEVIELGWPGAAEILRVGLRKSARYCGGG
jgi:hypothetical protein